MRINVSSRETTGTIISYIRDRSRTSFRVPSNLGSGSDHFIKRKMLRQMPRRLVYYNPASNRGFPSTVSFRPSPDLR